MIFGNADKADIGRAYRHFRFLGNYLIKVNELYGRRYIVRDIEKY